MSGIASDARSIPILASKKGSSALTRFWYVCIFSVLVRLLLLPLIWSVPLTSDAADYCAMARRLLEGVPFVPYWPPGLPLFLMPFAAAGASDAALRVPMLLFWVLACWGFLRLAQELDLSFAWLILLVFSLLPVSIHLSMEPLTQLPVAALFLVALSATLRTVRAGGWKEPVLLGLSLGAMGLVRPSALALLLVLPLIAAWRSRRVLSAALPMVLGLALVGGWMVRAHHLSGAWMINLANAQNLWDGNNPWTPLYRTWYFGSHAKLGTEEIHQFPSYKALLERTAALPPLQQPPVFLDMAQAYILAHPGPFLLRTANRVRAFWGFDTFTSLTLRKANSHLLRLTLSLEAGLYLLLMVPTIFYLAAAGREFWHRWQTWTIAVAVLLYAIPYWLSMSHPTYHYPVLAPMALLGAMAWQNSREAGLMSRSRGWVAIAMLLLIQVEWIWQNSHSL